MKLLTIENAKTSKGAKFGYLTGILYLAPHTIAGCGNVCPKSTPGCRAACLSILKHYLGYGIDVSSDGDADEWEEGVRLAVRVTGLSIENPLRGEE